MRKFSYEKQIQKQQRRENPKRAGNAPRPPIDCAPPSPPPLPCAALPIILWWACRVRR